MVEVTLIPKEERRELTFEDKILIGSLVILFLAGILAAGLFFYKNNLENQIGQLEESLVSLEKKRDLDLEKSVLQAAQTLNVAASLLDSHTYPSRFFEVLEKKIHPRIRLLAAEVDFAGNKFRAQAEAANFRAISQQIEIFWQEEKIKKVEVSNISLGAEGNIGFNLELEFDPRVFR